MSAVIKRQVIEKIKPSPMFANQLDESIDVASISQLMVFARYVHRKTIEEEFLFCSPLTETTTAADVMNLVSDFFSKEHLDWGKLIGVCTDGAPAMLGYRAGFAQLVKEKNPLMVSTHCFIHRQALAVKTLPKGLQEHLSSGITVVNFIKGSALQTRLFHKLCEDMDAVHSSQLVKFDGYQRVEGFHQCLAYLIDIFRSISEVKTKMQGRDRNVLNVTDGINAFKDKLKLWVERLATRNIPEQLQEKFLELTNNSAIKDGFKELSIEHVWVQAQRLYPNTGLATFKMVIPFASTYLCESAFSAMLTIESKSRNLLEVEADLRCALSTTTPNLKTLVSSKQTQKSH
ncbi:zinc finger BED domain-containing protein 5-like [Watersipora subatra]|uniref:zinc finger BED domain-containing protein 5-like n=1 Tax=Watersipora subatra TaxID=2589382 RepID=UPI00355C0CC8